MATSVAIKITVDSAQAQAALDAMKKSLKDTGIEGEVAFQKAGTGVKQLGGHAASSLDAVRLLSQEFGLRLPRALESMISRMQGLSGVINSVVGGLAAFAAVEVGAHLIEGLYKLEQQYISINAEANKFYETLKKTAQEDVANTRSLETTRRRSNDATQNTSAASGAASSLQGLGLGMFGTNPAAAVGLLLSAHNAASQSVVAAGDMVKLGKVNLDQAHQQALAQIELNHAMDASLTGAQKINAEAAKKKQINSEGREFDRKTELYYGNVSPGDAGGAAQRLKDQTADAEAAAQKTVLGRESALAIMKAQDEARQAGLEGDALYVEKRKDGIREITMQLQNQGKGEEEILAATASFAAKLDNERADRIEKQWHDAQQATRTASQAGLTGGSRVTAEFNNRLDQINTDRSLDPAAAAQLRIAAKTEETQKLKELEDNFTRAATLDVETRTGVEMGGFARIEAEAAKAIAEKQKAYDELGGTGGAGAKNALDADKAAIINEAHGREQQLTAANRAEDLQYAQEASRAEARVKEDGLLGWVAGYKNAIAEINDEDARRTAKLQGEALKQGLSEQEVAQRKVDIDRTANAQIAQQNEQLQHTIAGQLQSAFTDPVQFIKSAMEKMFFEIVAAWLMRLQVFKGLFGNTMSGLQLGGGGSSGGSGGILGSLFGGGSGGSGGGLSLGGGSGGSGIGSAISSSLGAAQGAPGFAKMFGFGGGSGAGSGIGGLTTGDPFDAAESTDSGLTSLIPDEAMPGSKGVPGVDFSSASGGLAAVGQAAGAAGGAFEAGSSIYNAFETGGVKGTLSGMLGGAAGGAMIGSLFGPEGTVIGAGVGAIAGLAAGIFGSIFGENKKHKARDYYNQSILPTLEQAANNPNYGDFQSAIANVNSTAAQGLSYMQQKFGKDAGNWVNDNYMKKEVLRVDAMISNSAEGGRQFTQMSASQFHSGGTIGGFGSFATSSTEGFIHAMLGETVMNPAASSTHAAALSAMNSGAGAADIAGAYLAKSGSMGSNSRSGGENHFHVHTLDTKTMEGWLKNGGAKLITRHQNNYAGAYAGDGIG